MLIFSLSLPIADPLARLDQGHAAVQQDFRKFVEDPDLRAHVAEASAAEATIDLMAHLIQHTDPVRCAALAAVGLHAAILSELDSTTSKE